METRQGNQDYTIRFELHVYSIDRADITTGLRGGAVHVEERRDGTIALRFQKRYLRCRMRESTVPVVSVIQRPAKTRNGPRAAGNSDWMKGFLDTPGPSIAKAIAISNATS